MENLRQELRRYIAENYVPETSFESFKLSSSFYFRIEPPNFAEMFAASKGETFSEMLLRLIAENGEKPAEIYNRAGVNRQHFYKIRHNENYKPSKQTVIAFAFALRLNIIQTQALLETAGYAFTRNNLGDVIEMFFLEREIFDLDTVNQYLDENNQPLLGDWKCNLTGDQAAEKPLYNPPRNSKGGSTLKNVTEIVQLVIRNDDPLKGHGFEVWQLRQDRQIHMDETVGVDICDPFHTCACLLASRKYFINPHITALKDSWNSLLCLNQKNNLKTECERRSS